MAEKFGFTDDIDENGCVIAKVYYQLLRKTSRKGRLDWIYRSPQYNGLVVKKYSTCNIIACVCCSITRMYMDSNLRNNGPTV